MRCPFCLGEDTQVKDSRPADESQAIRRRRQCAKCGARFTTFERVQLRELTVLKSSGRRVPFDREKLHRSLKIATRKRGIDDEEIDRLVSEVIRRLEATGETEVAARLIGEYAMNVLQDVDDVAYVRYASVYRDFREAKDFETFLGSMEQE